MPCKFLWQAYAKGLQPKERDSSQWSSRPCYCPWGLVIGAAVGYAGRVRRVESGV